MARSDQALVNQHSRSPDHDRHPRRRSRSPQPHDRRSHHKQRRSSPLILPVLPFRASRLSKHDLQAYKSLLTSYLDIQKQLRYQDLPEDEVRGRWKSFIGKWNRGELAEGWYDPATLRNAQASVDKTPHVAKTRQARRGSPGYRVGIQGEDGSSDDDMVGPRISQRGEQILSKTFGPSIPNREDLVLQRELEAESSLERRQALHHDRKSELKQNKERLEELVPRAEAGSKERMLEKKREKADQNRSFAASKTEAGGVVDVPDADLLDDGEDGIEGYKKQKMDMERKKNEREIRRDEIMRARTEEREERVREYKAREDKTMAGLIALAKARFG